jgi:hypothetical protein
MPVQCQSNASPMQFHDSIHYDSSSGPGGATRPIKSSELCARALARLEGRINEMTLIAEILITIKKR